MDWVHVRGEVSWSRHLGQGASQQFVIVQVVDDEEKTLETGVSLGQEFVVARQFRDGNIGKLGEQFLQFGVDFEMPTMRFELVNTSR